MSRQTRGFAFLVALLVTACAVTEETGVTAEQWDAVRRWLTCEECVDGELLEVESIGIRTVSVLVSTLEDLPEDAKLNLKRRFGVAWGSVAHTGADSTVYVDTHLANAIARTQVRSALALVVFERWDYVRMALDSAQAWEYREDVVEEIQEILFDPAASVVLYTNGTIRGQITSTGGLELGSATVYLRRCLTAPPATSPPGAGHCITYDGIALVTSTDATGEFAFNSMEEGVYEVVPDPGSVGGISSTPDAALYRLVGDGDEESSTFVVVM